MKSVASRILMLAVALAPAIVVLAQQTGEKPAPTSEQVYKDIQVFKGVPASDLIPAMQFMSVSMGYNCTDCHDPADYAKESKNKTTTRKMILMQREINEKHFDNRLEVTCMTCHSKEEHPVGMPVPTGVSLRHKSVRPAPKAADLIAAHLAASGPATGAIVRSGTLTAPNDATHKIETKPVEFIQAPGGQYRIVSGDRTILSDGVQTWFGQYPLADESAAVMGRIGRAWRGEDDFKGLTRTSFAGSDEIGTATASVLQGYRQATTSTEEIYFDTRTNLLSRLVNIRRSTIGTVVSAFDYTNYKKVGGNQVPMRLVVTFSDKDKWVFEFETAKVEASVDPKMFKPGG